MKQNFDVKIADIHKARQNLQKYVSPTPMIFSRRLSDLRNAAVYLKSENLQPIGSFKIRGATNRITQLTAEQRSKGVIAASLGNHAQGVAWSSRMLNTRALIVMPKDAPYTKINKTRNLGAEVHLEGETYNEANRIAVRMAEERDMVFIPAYQDPAVIAGQGTVGLEIVDQLPDVDMVCGPIGGGGLMSGVSIAMKSLLPNVHILGCQASGSSSMVDSVKKGMVVKLKNAHTFADGINVPEASKVMLKLLKDHVDSFDVADDQEISEAILCLMEEARVVAEGAGALPLAVLMKRKKEFEGKKVVLIISGGNIDVNLLARIIDQGLLKAGRRIRVDVVISDRPGSLYQLTHLVAKQGASVIQAVHDRSEPATRIDETKVHLTLETKGMEHSHQIVEELKKNVRIVEICGDSALPSIS